MADAIQHKTCSKCNRSLAIECFRLRRENGKRRNECRDCLNTYAKKYHEDNREEILRDNRARYSDPGYRAKVSERGKKYRANLSEEKRSAKRDYFREWQRENLDRRRVYVQNWKEKDRDHALSVQRRASRKHYWDNRESERLRANNASKTDAAREARRKRDRRRRKDGEFAATQAFRGRIREALKGRVSGSGAFRRLEYSKDELARHLERQFLRGMTWDNYGSKWHIDHIIPIASFDMSDPEQFQQCWALTNLRPMWAIDNIRKGAKRTHLL